MLMGFLAGKPTLITSTYVHGIRSVIRENLLLEALAKKAVANIQFTAMQLETQFAAFFDPGHVQDIFRKRMSRARWLNQLSSMELDAKEPMLMAVESLARLYTALEKSGIIQDDPDVVDEEPGEPNE